MVLPPLYGEVQLIYTAPGVIRVVGAEGAFGICATRMEIELESELYPITFLAYT